MHVKFKTGPVPSADFPLKADLVLSVASGV